MEIVVLLIDLLLAAIYAALLAIVIAVLAIAIRAYKYSHWLVRPEVAVLNKKESILIMNFLNEDECITYINGMEYKNACKLSYVYNPKTKKSYTVQKDNNGFWLLSAGQIMEVYR